MLLSGFYSGLIVHQIHTDGAIIIYISESPKNGLSPLKSAIPPLEKASYLISHTHHAGKIWTKLLSHTLGPFSMTPRINNIVCPCFCAQFFANLQSPL